MFGNPRVEYTWSIDNSGIRVNNQRDAKLVVRALVHSASCDPKPGSLPAQDLLQRRFSREAVEGLNPSDVPIWFDTTEMPTVLGALGELAETVGTFTRRRATSLMGIIATAAHSEFSYLADAHLRQ